MLLNWIAQHGLESENGMPKQKKPQQIAALPKEKEEPWTEAELNAAVLAYLDMQRKHDQGQKINRKQVYRDLAAEFPRSEKAFERRMLNISFVLQEMGRPWLKGLMPARNVGTTNSPIIQRFILAASPELVPVAKEFTEHKGEDYTVPPIPAGVAKPKKEIVPVTQIVRDAKVKEWVMGVANGHCECCQKPAPFNRIQDGEPFLELHHLVLLADDGPDTIQNAVAICPNCHRELHFGENRVALREQMYGRISRLKSA